MVGMFTDITVSQQMLVLTSRANPTTGKLQTRRPGIRVSKLSISTNENRVLVTIDQ